MICYFITPLNLFLNEGIAKEDEIMSVKNIPQILKAYS